MKTRMEMLPNGNYESVVCYIQHECRSKDYSWSCNQYSDDMKKLILEVEFGDPYEDGYGDRIEVNFCPFCGYQPERLSPEGSIFEEKAEYGSKGHFGLLNSTCDSLNSMET